LCLKDIIRLQNAGHDGLEGQVFHEHLSPDFGSIHISCLSTRPQNPMGCLLGRSSRSMMSQLHFTDFAFSQGGDPVLLANFNPT